MSKQSVVPFAAKAKPVITVKFDPITPAALAKLYERHGLDNWPIKSNTGYESGPATLVPHEFLKKGENYVVGPVMRERGKELARAFSLDNLLVMVEEENTKPGSVIPKEYRGQRYFPADGTVLLIEDGSECLACAYWDTHIRKWPIYVSRLGDVWLSGGRLLRSRK